MWYKGKCLGFFLLNDHKIFCGWSPREVGEMSSSLYSQTCKAWLYEASKSCRLVRSVSWNGPPHKQTIDQNVAHLSHGPKEPAIIIHGYWVLGDYYLSSSTSLVVSLFLLKFVDFETCNLKNTTYDFWKRRFCFFCTFLNSHFLKCTIKRKTLLDFVLKRPFDIEIQAL